MFKSWLRDLPDEILPKNTQKEIEKAYDPSSPPRSAPQELKDALSNLPPYNYYLLFAITCHISLLHSCSAGNKMTYHNICVCFPPCMKIEQFCFKYLVLDWRNCWQGCWTEKEWLADEEQIREAEENVKAELEQNRKLQQQADLMRRGQQQEDAEYNQKALEEAERMRKTAKQNLRTKDVAERDRARKEQTEAKRARQKAARAAEKGQRQNPPERAISSSDGSLPSTTRNSSPAPESRGRPQIQTPARSAKPDERNGSAGGQKKQGRTEAPSLSPMQPMSPISLSKAS